MGSLRTGASRPQVRPLAVRLALGLLLFVLVGWGAGALWTAVAGPTDLEALRQVAEQRSQELTAVARVVTWAGSALVLAPLAVVCCWLLVRAGLRGEAVAVALSLSGAILLADIVKLLVSRQRPPVEHLQTVTSASFPSSHATQASAFWLSLVLALPAIRMSTALKRAAAGAALLIVLAVAFSRVYLGVHFPADVVAGLLLGTGWALFIARSLRRCNVA
jgi:undecaprenyl-diphosphatase